MGDLADIIRATGAGGNIVAEEWQFQTNTITSDPVDEFGNPFTHLRDPLIDTPLSEFTFHNNSSTNVVQGRSGNSGEIANASYYDEMKRPNIFSRMLQISPDPKLQVPVRDSPAPLATAAVAVTPRVLRGISISNNNNDLIYPNGCNGVQISSPRNTGNKRRKSQAKKVVCIPAPAPANSRPSSGEIVPSDLWAWRKYGQKPIKGSPYPRGYYRCSSSKGCPARKQVERSRTDPNMLVITYTSEHNHPWPTQRNALAGSTRSHQAPAKNTSTPKSAPVFQAQNPSGPKQNHKEKNELGPKSVAVKLEVAEYDQLETDDPDFDDGYDPELRDGSNHPEDSFFADLGEIEPDPLDLIFGNKGFDSVGYNYWAGNNGGATTSEHSATSFYGSAKRDS